MDTPMKQFDQAMTVKELKDYVRDLPEVGSNGEPYEVWVGTGKYLSSPVVLVCRLNEGDMLLEPPEPQDS